MKPELSRLLLGLSAFICIGISACSSLLNMSYLAATGLTTEIADEATSMERRSEIAQGLDNAVMIQSGLVNVIWWLALVAILLIAGIAFWGFRMPGRQAPVA